MRRLWIAAPLLAFAACTTPNPDYCAADKPCTDPLRPYCDLTGAHNEDGTRNVCVPDPDLDAGPIDGDGGGGAGDGGGTPDADLGVVPEIPRLLAPHNGATTGSVFSDDALRPRFRWLAAERADTYELELDDSCPVFGFADCAFDSPELTETGIDATEHRPASAMAVSTTAPVGRRYTWRVRACNAAGCSPWSVPRYVDVGRQLSDFNGDGYADRVVGMSARTADPAIEGKAFIYFGKADWGAPATVETADVTIDDPNGEAGAEFGRKVAAAGDLDGDGFADVVVTSPTADRFRPDGGAAYVYLGRAEWPATVTAFDSELLNPQSNDPPPDFLGGFGIALAGGGDINADGFADIAVAATSLSEGATAAGIVYAYFGRPTWPALSVNSDIVFYDPYDQPQSAFGFAIALSGDLDADGASELVVSSFGMGIAVQPGAAFVLFGRTDWGSSPAELSAADQTVTNPKDEAGFFGNSLTSSGDINGDGYDDLVVGAMYMSEPEIGEGNAFLYLGSENRPTTATEADAVFDHPGDRALGTFARSLSSGGDVNGDGVDDLVVGASTTDDEGEVYVFLGRAVWPAQIIMADSFLQNPVVAGATMGTSVTSVGDVDGDGVADVTAGLPTKDAPESNEGNAFMWLGRSAWPSVVSEPDVTFDNPTDTPNSLFGDSLD